MTRQLSRNVSQVPPDTIEAAIRRKIQRLQRGAGIRTLDLFAGCGGLSLGFASAGFHIVGGLESDPLASQSHHFNFAAQSSPSHTHDYPCHDITQVSPQEVVAEFGLGTTTTDAVDVIIGGPPCQAFARVGRAKLREIDQHPDAFLRDTRANLYLRYLHFVRAMHPIALVMENVPDALNYGGHNICEEMCDVLTADGYECCYTLLNSAFYGVPQMRERVFLFAIRRELNTTIAPPVPTHYVKLPPGYEGTRAVALKSLTRKSGGDSQFFVHSPPADRRLPAAISAREALADLPPILGHLDGTIRRGTRRFDTPVSYAVPHEHLTPYCRLMREWPGWPTTGHIYDHVIRSLPRDYQIFRAMNPGDQYPEAHAIALQLFAQQLRRARQQGKRITDSSPQYQQLKKSIVPPYDPSKFPNKWRKMEADLPARTLLAHLGKDSYSHIHYDSEQARTISVREAARLQSFPDGFRFFGTMNPAFRQIGNAVPPLLANAVAHSVLKALGMTPRNHPLATLLISR